jgi:UDP-N-acetylmuramoyl-tripeptide--D-alanyl-D-alanine ligase
MASPILLSAHEIAQVTDGSWLNVVDLNRPITGLTVTVDLTHSDSLVFITTPQQWGKQVPNTFRHLNQIVAKNPYAVVVTPQQAKSIAVPALRVRNPRVALEQIATAARDRSNATRVLITGTQGKTGSKLLIGELLRMQGVPVHFFASSKNLDVPVLLSLGTLAVEHRICVTEVAVANPGVGARRSRYVSPHLCVFTNANPCHVGTHGNIERMLVEKASAVVGLDRNGPVVINQDSFFFPQLKQCILRHRSDAKIFTYGTGWDCHARLISADLCDGKWQVEASIQGKRFRYQLGVFQSHAPVSTLGGLLALDLLQHDLDQATQHIANFKYSYESTGQQFVLQHPNGNFVFIDQHYSNNEYSLSSAIDDVIRMPARGKKIIVIGALKDHVRYAEGAYLRIARKLDRSDIDKVYTYGSNIFPLRRFLQRKNLFQRHFERLDEIKDELFNVIQEGDVLMIKAQGTSRFAQVSEAILQKYPAVTHFEPQGARPV